MIRVLLLPIVCVVIGVSRPDSSKVERLLCLAECYEQVEKAILLLPWNSPIITRVPCISPLQVEDLRHIPVSSAYGRRLHPILHEYKHHAGVDLPAELGERVYATTDGVVIAAGYDSLLGNYTKLEHDYGFITVYGHLQACAVSVGDTVRIGRVIGYVGTTGRSTGPHLHYGIRKHGREQDPLPYCYLYLRWQEMQMRKVNRRSSAD